MNAPQASTTAVIPVLTILKVVIFVLALMVFFLVKITSHVKVCMYISLFIGRDCISL